MKVLHKSIFDRAMLLHLHVNHIGSAPIYIDYKYMRFVTLKLSILQSSKNQLQT